MFSTLQELGIDFLSFVLFFFFFSSSLLLFFSSSFLLFFISSFFISFLRRISLLVTSIPLVHIRMAFWCGCDVGSKSFQTHCIDIPFFGRWGGKGQTGFYPRFLHEAWGIWHTKKDKHIQQAREVLGGF